NLPSRANLLPPLAMRRLGRLALAAAINLSLLTISHGADARRAPLRGGARRGVPGLTRDGLPNIQAQAAVIVDLKGGGDFYAKNPDAVRPIASISKLMASLVVLDQGLQLDRTQTITLDDKKVAWKGARARLIEGM